MPVYSPQHSILRKDIEARNDRRGLSESMEKMDYALGYLRPWLKTNGRHVLVVGIGQGHDAVHALLNGDVEHITGVDPYIDEDGNDSSDYQFLLELVAKCGLEKRCTTHRATLQEYASKAGSTMQGAFSMALIPFTMHHIFVTQSPLAQSELLPEAIAFFRTVHDLLEPNGVLVLNETIRHGLRPLLKRLGIIGGEVEYSTKQGWNQWRSAIEPAGFALRRHIAYTPYALRRFKVLFDMPIGLAGPCDRYFSIYNKL